MEGLDKMEAIEQKEKQYRYKFNIWEDNPNKQGVLDRLNELSDGPIEELFLKETELNYILFIDVNELLTFSQILDVAKTTQNTLHVTMATKGTVIHPFKTIVYHTKEEERYSTEIEFEYDEEVEIQKEFFGYSAIEDEFKQGEHELLMMQADENYFLVQEYKRQQKRRDEEERQAEFDLIEMEADRKREAALERAEAFKQEQMDLMTKQYEEAMLKREKEHEDELDYAREEGRRSAMFSSIFGCDCGSDCTCW